MAITSPIVDRSQEMDEKSWWDLWNTSHRTKDNNDVVSSELFTRAAAAVNRLTRHESCLVLEIACGTGTFSRMLAYSSYHGLDISPAAIEIARQKSSSVSLPPIAVHPTYEAADFHEWPLPAQPYDVVICIDAISSIRDQPVAMKKMAQGLRVGGHLVLTTINRFVYDRIERSSTVRFESGPVSHWLTRAELRDLVVQAGLTVDLFTTIMPRGNLGVLRVLNSGRLNQSFGPKVAAVLRRLKEQAGLGQYSLVIARKNR